MERCTKRTELPYSFCAHSCTNTLHPWGPNLHGIHFNTKSSFTESQKTEEKNQDRCTKIQGAQERTGGKIQSYWRHERRCYESKGKWKAFCNLCVILYSLSFSIKIVLTFKCRKGKRRKNSSERLRRSNCNLFTFWQLMKTASTDCVSCHFIFAKWKSAHKSSPSVSSSMVLCKLKRPHTLTENCVKLIKQKCQPAEWPCSGYNNLIFYAVYYNSDSHFHF